MKRKRYCAAVLAAVVIAGSARALRAADAYYWIPVSQLATEGDALPNRLAPANFRTAHHYQPRVQLDGDGEAYVRCDDVNRVTAETTQIAARSPQGKGVKGTLYWPRRVENGKPQDDFAQVRFAIAPSAADAMHRAGFLHAKVAHYQRLLAADMPGGAWFRHQVDLTRRELGQPSETPANTPMRQFFGRRGGQLEETYALVSGGRALSENLQLDRVLPTTDVGVATVDVDKIAGITVREYEWDVEKLQPEIDPLARWIPDDQHALFFPSFDALVDLVHHADELGTPILNIAQPRGESARTRERYEKQLGISLGEIAPRLRRELVSSVAVTGSDPYFRTGTDVAVLFESNSAGALRELLESQIKLASSSTATAEPVTGRVGAMEYTGLRSPNREVSSYVAARQDVVIVTNSLEQLAAIAAVAAGERSALAGLPEYTFFRDRYRRDEAETALLLVSDKTIRRWCGPKWRIATSRRTRALAVMTDLQAANMNRLVSAGFVPGAIYSDRWQHLVGDLMLDADGVRSSLHGSLEFQTPIAELDVQLVTAEEKAMYERWREGYQRNWSTFFDPIAVRFKIDDDRLAADLTVMPLIAGSQYNQYIEISKGAEIGANDGDPHAESLVHFVLAIEPDSELVRQGTNIFKMFAPQVNVDPLSWMGESIAVYAEESPVWKELAESKDHRFAEANFHRFPVALYVEVQSGLRLTAFLAGVRAFVEQTAPGMTVWESLEHAGQPYVKVSPTERARQNERELPEDAGLYYAASGDHLLVTINHDLLRRALERYAGRQKTDENGEGVERSGPPWLGKNLSAQVDHRALEFFEFAYRNDYQQLMQNVAWNNIAILNEWKHRYPDRDPVALHQGIWKTRLQSPAGDGYRWNEAWQTMESISYGHPGEPKPGPAFPAALRAVAQANFGVTFEEDGLRTRVELKQKKSP
jgi:hypothetical protein